jgi:glutathione S-transferase
LNEKRVDYDVECIDLRDPPNWFKDVSPMRKVPVLVVGKHAIFESGVINELLDEVYPTRLHPHDVFRRAMNRSWIEFGNQLTQDAHWMSVAKSEEEYSERLSQFHGVLDQLETAIDRAPFFNGEEFSLVDATYAPVFARISILQERGVEIVPVSRYTKVAQWSDSLVRHPAVIDSVDSTFKHEYLAFLNGKQSFLMRHTMFSQPGESRSFA